MRKENDEPMVHLTLAGLSEDGRRLLLVSDAGVEFTLDADDRLRAALSGDRHARARLGQLEIKMESVLRPRDIQARIRAGETPEAVAAAAQTTVDKIMPFAAPVLAEREHVAQRAQRASLRRGSSATATGSRTLGDAVAGHLRSRNVDPTGVDWDAWRREDGRWTLTATYRTPDHDGQGAFTFDAPGNYVAAEDDDARWLVGDEAPSVGAAAAAPADDDLASARRRRLTAVAAHDLPEDVPDELPLGEDALDLVSPREHAHPDETSALGAEAPVEAYLDDPETAPAHGEADRSALADDAGDDARDDGDAAEGAPAARPARRKGRASVPSWDEIMFGGGKHD